MATSSTFVLQVVFWLVVLTSFFAVCVLHTRHRLRARYDLKTSELSEALRSLHGREVK